MEDSSIIQLYWERSERAIEESAAKYGNYCRSIARQILQSAEDAEESVNDTWLGAWNAMPPHRPAILSAFLGKITRRLSIDRWRARSAEKRGGGEVALALEELTECISREGSAEEAVELCELEGAVNVFLDSLPVTERRVFLCRYWYLEPVEAIADRFGFSRSKTASMLHRTRAKLRRTLEKEGF